MKTSKANNTYTEYVIEAGKHYPDLQPFEQINLSELSFKVLFDSSAIYQTHNKANQADINKLYGFSDNHMMHHQYSARFGWRWYQNQLSLLAYVYNDSIWFYKNLGTIEIGKIYECRILVEGDHYDFVLNDNITSMPRRSTTATAIGYKLYPYFGGDETAPHPVRIKIAEE